MNVNKDMVADEILNTLPSLFKGLVKNFVRDSEENENQECLGSHMSGSHLHVLFAIEKMGPCPISNIAKKIFISKPNMTPILDKLIAAGLIKREYSEKDRRIINVCATDQGKVFIREKKEKIQKSIAEKLENLDEKDLSDLYSALKKIKDIIGKLNDGSNCLYSAEPDEKT